MIEQNYAAQPAITPGTKRTGSFWLVRHFLGPQHPFGPLFAAPFAGCGIFPVKPQVRHQQHVMQGLSHFASFGAAGFFVRKTG
ncbi:MULTISPECIES: hypothetical protein [Micrococcaceae]|uniref:hypothetical protein n=1 Tax=Micrococcaceae TaxID=1268 RepID=UPI00105C8CE6|nr:MULTISPECIES: hypothetical protein [unclassified Arthrobacter]